VNDALETEDVAAINSACESLQQATHAFTEQMYKASQEAGAAEGAAPEAGGAATSDEEDVIDAEFEKKD